MHQGLRYSALQKLMKHPNTKELPNAAILFIHAKIFYITLTTKQHHNSSRRKK